MHEETCRQTNNVSKHMGKQIITFIHKDKFRKSRFYFFYGHRKYQIKKKTDGNIKLVMQEVIRSHPKDTERKKENVGKTNLDSLDALDIYICDIHMCNHIYP